MLSKLVLLALSASTALAAVGCAAGQTRCGSMCFNLQKNPNHCGSCTTACASGQSCVNGVCTGGTPPPPTTCTPACTAPNPNCCGTTCTNFQTDNNNCGACGTVCTGGTTCQAGVCKAPAPTCTPACTAPNPNCCGNQCTNFLTSNGNCGGCSIACSGATPTCCNGACTNIYTTDSNNCGACGNVCGAGSHCVNGACTGACTQNGQTCGSTPDCVCVTGVDGNIHCANDRTCMACQNDSQCNVAGKTNGVCLTFQQQANEGLPACSPSGPGSGSACYYSNTCNNPPPPMKRSLPLAFRV